MIPRRIDIGRETSMIANSHAARRTAHGRSLVIASMAAMIALTASSICGSSPPAPIPAACSAESGARSGVWSCSDRSCLDNDVGSSWKTVARTYFVAVGPMSLGKVSGARRDHFLVGNAERRRHLTEANPGRGYLPRGGVKTTRAGL